MKFLIVLAALAAAASAAPANTYKEPEKYAAAPAVEYSKPAVATYKPAATYAAPSYETYNYAPQPYSFAYAVKDDYYYNDYAHEQKSDDKGYVTGSYRVLLPDGRTQIVTYVADNYGYRADVKYEGVAKPYEYTKPAYKAPVVAYQAAPAAVYEAPAVEYKKAEY